MVKNIEMVVFDMAGTTVDEGGTVYRTLQRALRRGGHDFEYDEILQAAGRSKFSAIEQLLGLRMDAVDRDLSERIHEDFRQLILTTYLEKGVSEQPGASKVFRLLKERGFGSSSTRDTTDGPRTPFWMVWAGRKMAQLT